MSAAPSLPAAECSSSVDREAIAFVLAGWSGYAIEAIDAMLPPHLDRAAVVALAAGWLDALALKPTAERVEALSNVGVRRASVPRVRVARAY
jgi:hypothetical protein